MVGWRKIVIYTIVLHHPSRPVRCLARTLDALSRATAGKKHIVDVIFQGVMNRNHGYPTRGKNYRLIYTEVGRNIGIGGGFKLGVKNFLKSGAGRLAKIDDDIAVPRWGWDVLDGILSHEARVGERKLGAVMMSTDRTRVRLLKYGVSVNGIPTVKPVNGNRGTGREKLCGYSVVWKITDFSDVGCTLYPRSLFEDGCVPDEALFVGGIGLDLVYQGNKRGYSWAVCRTPRCEHFAEECHNVHYSGVRSNRETYARSHAHFYKKWGVVSVMLAKVAGKVKQNGKIHV